MSNPDHGLLWLHDKKAVMFEHFLEAVGVGDVQPEKTPGAAKPTKYIWNKLSLNVVCTSRIQGKKVELVWTIWQILGNYE